MILPLCITGRSAASMFTCEDDAHGAVHLFAQAQEQAGPQKEQLVPAGQPVNASPSKRTATALQGPGRSTPEPAKTTPTKGPTPGTPQGKEAKAAEVESKQQSTLGSFYHLPHYRKLFEVFSGAYRNFKVMCDLISMSHY